MKRNHPERDEVQIPLVKYIQLQYPGLTIQANIGEHLIRAGQRVWASRMGFKPGDPDIFIFDTTDEMGGLGPYKGLGIECKYKNRPVTRRQKERHAVLMANGWLVIVARNFEQGVTWVDRCYKNSNHRFNWRRE